MVALKSQALTGSPKYLILLGLVLLSDVILLEKSDNMFLPISAPKPFNKPPSLKPIAESTDAPMASPLATPEPTIPSSIMFFNNGFDMLPGTAGAPNVLDCMIP